MRQPLDPQARETMMRQPLEPQAREQGARAALAVAEAETSDVQASPAGAPVVTELKAMWATGTGPLPP